MGTPIAPLLTAKILGPTSVELSWTSTNYVGGGYTVKKDGLLYVLTYETKAVVTGLTPNRTYSFNVLATLVPNSIDQTSSNTLEIKTPSAAADIRERYSVTTPNTSVSKNNLSSSTITFGGSEVGTYKAPKAPLNSSKIARIGVSVNGSTDSTTINSFKVDRTASHNEYGPNMVALAGASGIRKVFGDDNTAVSGVSITIAQPYGPFLP